MAQEMGGFDAQVASGKLRECAGCAPQCDTEVDTLPALVRPSSHRDIGWCPTQQEGPERRWDARGLDPYQHGAGPPSCQRHQRYCDSPIFVDDGDPSSAVESAVPLSLTTTIVLDINCVTFRWSGGIGVLWIGADEGAGGDPDRQKESEDELGNWMGGDHGVLPRLHAVRPLGRCLGGYRSRRRAGVLRGVSLATGREGHR